MRTNKKILVLGVIIALTAKIALADGEVVAQEPAWIHDTDRHVVGGDIIQFGTGEIPLGTERWNRPEVALFMAKQMAIRALVEECGGVAHKDITPRKQFFEQKGNHYQAYATVSLSFDACEAAKKPHDKSIENAKIIEDQRLYEKLTGLQPVAAPAPEPAEGTKELISRTQKMIEMDAEVRAEQLGEIKERMLYIQSLLRDKNKPMVVPHKLVALVRKKGCWVAYKHLKRTYEKNLKDLNNNPDDPLLQQQFKLMQQQEWYCTAME